MEFSDINSKEVIEEIYNAAKKQNRLDIIQIHCNPHWGVCGDFDEPQDFYSGLVKSGNKVVRSFIEGCINTLGVKEEQDLTFTFGLVNGYSEGYVVVVRVCWVEQEFIREAKVQFTEKGFQRYFKKQMRTKREFLESVLKEFYTEPFTLKSFGSA